MDFIVAFANSARNIRGRALFFTVLGISLALVTLVSPLIVLEYLSQLTIDYQLNLP
jgi:hypothetical protein